jgi:hypothetical protein
MNFGRFGSWGDLRSGGAGSNLPTLGNGIWRVELLGTLPSMSVTLSDLRSPYSWHIRDKPFDPAGCEVVRSDIRIGLTAELGKECFRDL